MRRVDSCELLTFSSYLSPLQLSSTSRSKPIAYTRNDPSPLIATFEMPKEKIHGWDAESIKVIYHQLTNKPLATFDQGVHCYSERGCVIRDSSICLSTRESLFLLSRFWFSRIDTHIIADWIASFGVRLKLVTRRSTRDPTRQP